MKSLQEGLVLELLFDGDANDTSGQGNHGTVTGATLTQDSKGRNNRAYDFISANLPKITVSDSASIVFGSPFTIATLVNMDDATKFRLVHKNNSSFYEFDFSTDASDLLFLTLSDNSLGTNTIRKGTTALTSLEGSWALLVATYDGREGVNSEVGITLYYDAVPESSYTDAYGGYLAGDNTAAPITIGYVDKGTLSYADGRFEYVKIWNRELSADEVWQLYADIKGNYQGLFDGCVLNLDMNGDALDSSGQGNDGTVTGATLATDRFGIANNCYHFVSSALDNIRIPHSSGISFTGPFTVSCWYKEDDLLAPHHLITKADLSGGVTVNYFLRTLTGGSVQVVVYGLSTASIVSPLEYSAGIWRMATAVYDGSNLILYINGVEINSVAVTGTPTVDTQDAYIGARLNNSLSGIEGGTDGSIDQPLIIGRGLSAGEVKALYDLTKIHPNLHEYPR